LLDGGEYCYAAGAFCFSWIVSMARLASWVMLGAEEGGMVNTVILIVVVTVAIAAVAW
jgi:hypothetical protein